MRQEELKQRKNKIIQLLNGEISDEEEGHVIDQSSGGDDFADDEIGEQFLDEAPPAKKKEDVKEKH